MAEHMASAKHPVGVITPDISGYYFGVMVRGIHQILQRANIPIVVIQQQLHKLQIPCYGSDYMSGWIVLHPSDDDRSNLLKLSKLSAPVITVPVPLADVPCTSIQVDNLGGMRDVVLHLIGHGHRRIAYVDHGDMLWSQQRYQGYCAALAQHQIPADPVLVIRNEALHEDGAQFHYERGYYAVNYLLQHAIDCTAVVAPTDSCAIAVIEAFERAGRHVPNDFAVVGFDNLAEAQYLQPPLTTVGVQFDLLGAAAAEQLLEEIAAGHDRHPTIISVPTIPMYRSSCGCSGIYTRWPVSSLGGEHQWQEELIQQLVQTVYAPRPLPADIPIDTIWPGARTLVAALDAALRGQATEQIDLENVWRQAVQHTEDLVVLTTCMTLLEDVVEQNTTVIPAVRAGVVDLIRRMYLELLRARLSYETAPKHLLAAQVRSNYAVSMALLDSDNQDLYSLEWLAATRATWGCLTIWAEGSNQLLDVVGMYERSATPTAITDRRLSQQQFPPIDQIHQHAAMGQDMTILCPVSTHTREWGVLMIGGLANDMLASGSENLSIQASLLGAALDRNHVLSTLRTQQDSLQQAYDRERMLTTTIQELGCPMIPLLPGILLVPLIGAIDSYRAQSIFSAVLAAISAEQSTHVILDVTGVALVDTHVAGILIQTAKAAELLGAAVVMVGIRPDIAQSMVSLGVDLSSLRKYATVASAIQVLLPRQTFARLR
ncbi:MAG: hypothetical protein Fur005_43740 [Roseiflexaceae bacterium]